MSNKISPSIQGKGLFIGINYSGANKLNGCENDSKSLKKYFEGKGFECELMIKDQTKANIIKKIKDLATHSFQGTRNFIIQYSGHGTTIPDGNGDERDGKDEGLVSLDTRILVDDELFLLFKNFHPLSKIFLIIDACHSGSILDLPYSYINVNGSVDVDNYITTQNNNEIEQKIFMISGCRDDQYSMDTYSNRRREHCGALSNALINYDFSSLPIFNLKAIIENDIHWANQQPCLSSSFKLENKSILSYFE